MILDCRISPRAFDRIAAEMQDAVDAVT